MLRVGLIGLGAIGRSIVDLWGALPPSTFNLAAVCVRPAAAGRSSRNALGHTGLRRHRRIIIDPPSLRNRSSWSDRHRISRRQDPTGRQLTLCTISWQPRSRYAPQVLAGCRACRQKPHPDPRRRLAGFDGLLTMDYDIFHSVKYTSTKPCNAWQDTLASETHELDRLKERTVIFRGNASDAARSFPKNANLAAAVALAGIGFERTQIELGADPNVKGNIGTLEAMSQSSTMTLTVSSSPSSNPKTSANVGASVIAALRNSAALIRFV